MGNDINNITISHHSEFSSKDYKLIVLNHLKERKGGPIRRG